MRTAAIILVTLIGSFAGGFAHAMFFSGAVASQVAVSGLLSIAQSVTGSPNTNNGMLDVAYAANQIWMTANVDASGAPSGSQTVNGLAVEIDSKGSSATGNTQAIQGVTYVQQVKSGQSPGTLNFVGIQGLGQSNINVGGTLNSPLGGLFGFGAAAILGTSNATYWLNVTGVEYDTEIVSGASTTHKSGVSVAQLPGDAVQGSVYDAGVSVSKQSGAVGWQNALLISDYNGAQPMVSSGTIIATKGSGATTGGIDFTSYTFTGNAIATPGFSVDGNGNVTANLAGGTPSTYACFTSGGKLISSVNAC